jgi:hypothetical protein
VGFRDLSLLASKLPLQRDVAGNEILELLEIVTLQAILVPKGLGEGDPPRGAPREGEKGDQNRRGNQALGQGVDGRAVFHRKPP